MDNKLELAHVKLEELMAVHKEHPETRNHYLTDTYNALQRKQSEAETTNVLLKAFQKRSSITNDDIPSLLASLQEKRKTNMDLVTAESTYNAMEAFYKSCCHNSSY